MQVRENRAALDSKFVLSLVVTISQSPRTISGNKNGPIGATELLVTPVEYFKKRRRIITLVHSEKGVVVDDPRIALIPYDTRVKGFEACLQWLNRQDCESASHTQSLSHSHHSPSALP